MKIPHKYPAIPAVMPITGPATAVDCKMPEECFCLRGAFGNKELLPSQMIRIMHEGAANAGHDLSVAVLFMCSRPDKSSRQHYH